MLSAPFQESELITNKTDKDGHHYLKVLLLSNKKTRNNWIVPYQKIGDLSQKVIDSFMDLPHIDEHSHPYFIELKEKLQKEGKSDDEIVKTLKEESKKLGTINYIDHIFMDDPNSSLLYGQLKIMNPSDNEYIKTYKKLPKNFTSPGIFGDAAELEDGTNVYVPDTVRAFHLASVDIPAFPEQEAVVKGVCANGNSQSCRKVLAVAGFNSTDPMSTVPSENVNNTCSCNKNIEMSTNNPQITASTPTTDATQPPQVNVNPTGNLTPGAQNTTAEAIEAARAEANKVIQENNKKVEEEKKAVEEEQNKPQLTEAEIELKKTNKLLEQERNEKLEMKNFFLEKMLISAIPKENFVKEDEFIQLKESTKGLIVKYGMSLEDAEWVINKVSKSVPSSTATTETDDKKSKKSVGVAGFLGSTYNSDSLTKSQSVPVSQSKDNGGANLDDEEYPIF
ncbi:MAG: hypothetical protein ACHQ1D_05070 [Nitrososphaerales archaeon]